MTHSVSPCCGQDYSDSVDKEGYSIYTCDNPKCKETFTEPLEEYEFGEQMKDAYLEDKMEERRLEL